VQPFFQIFKPITHLLLELCRLSAKYISISNSHGRLVIPSLNQLQSAFHCSAINSAGLWFPSLPGKGIPFRGTPQHDWFQHPTRVPQLGITPNSASNPVLAAIPTTSLGYRQTGFGDGNNPHTHFLSFQVGGGKHWHQPHTANHNRLATSYFDRAILNCFATLLKRSANWQGRLATVFLVVNAHS